MESIKTYLPLSNLEAKELLSREETAKLLQINLSTLWSWTKKGKLTSYGIGSKVYYKYSEIINKSLRPLN
ncbi:helix-turn-helix domain-containing protein [Arcticibacterium luteifluviistationis]|uniref:Helix-turn-helix domain-containing protein n=1 Tax=Arcticibacterium luteifluviistationis TaxID=1784714 RepID=A0A2Z4G6L2_9BACT|nr:helix-turn-helix domain-containing protein [Arcticibacterium luteifluviistationis]AWV96713.1 hypothetical protein DJ013_00300 [Arcticibacterium luteifluviistationis]